MQPGTVVLSWPAVGGGTHTASDAAVSGTLAGNATGTVSYARNEIEFVPTILPAPGAIISVDYFDAPKQVDPFDHPARDGNGKVPVVATLGAIEPGSLEVEWDTATSVTAIGTYTRDQIAEMGVQLGGSLTHIARDDGSGNIKLNGVTIGTVTYGTGAVLFNPDVTTKIPRPNLSTGVAISSGPGVLGVNGGVDGPPTTRYRLNVSGVTYISTPCVYPGANGLVELRYNSAAGSAAQTQEFPFSPTLEIIEDVRPALLPGALVLRVGGELMGDSGVGVLRTHQAGGWINRGTLSYTNATASLTSWPAGAANAFDRLSCISAVRNTKSLDNISPTALMHERRSNAFAAPAGHDVSEAVALV